MLNLDKLLKVNENLIFTKQFYKLIIFLPFNWNNIKPVLFFFGTGFTIKLQPVITNVYVQSIVEDCVSYLYTRSSYSIRSTSTPVQLFTIKGIDT